MLPAVRRVVTREELSLVYEQLIDKLGPVRPCRQCITETDVPAQFRRNLDSSFLEDSLLSTALREKLRYIRANRNQKRNRYVSVRLVGNAGFSGEKSYADKPAPDEGYRLLALFRYWNIINYFFPYKYAIGEDWNRALVDLIPVFERADSASTYQRALFQMVARIHDGHGFLRNTDNTVGLRMELGRYWAPFNVKLMEGRALIADFPNDSLAVANGLSAGMIISKIDGQSINDRVAELRPVVSASNESSLLRDVRSLLFIGPTPNATLTLMQDGREQTRTVARYPYSAFQPSFQRRPPVPTIPCRWVSDSIGYVDMGQLQHRQVDSVMTAFRSAKALIFDLRNYPNGTIFAVAAYLNLQPKPMAQLVRPHRDFPGLFEPLRLVYAGKRNPNPYKGRVLILANEETQSQAEFTTMAFQTAERAVVIGSQTAGADGDITWIPLPGGYQTAISGLGVYYPDGRETQRIGIVPDIEVRPTIRAVQAGRDEVLEKAIDVAKTGRR